MADRREKFLEFIETDFPEGEHKKEIIRYVQDNRNVFDFTGLIGSLERKIGLLTHFPEEENPVGPYKDMLAIVRECAFSAGQTSSKTGFHMASSQWYSYQDDD